jgi:glyoxylase-like metal-dependent hydrolase (beta-lactamase superfamily II)
MLKPQLALRLAACLGLACAPAAAEPVARDTANAVSLDPGAPNSYRTFAPELPATVARFPQIDPALGLHVREAKPGLFFVTDGVYQSAFVRTGDGVIVIDAPPSFAAKLPGVIAARVPDEPIRYLLYSHGHADHVGGASAFAGVRGLRVVAPTAVAAALARGNHRGILPPNLTYDQAYSFSLGRESVRLRTANFHAETVDAIIHMPARRFVVAVDTITPGEVPFMNFGATARLNGYLALFDEILRYDFDTILSGHTSVLGTRDDVMVTRDYVRDVHDTVRTAMAQMGPGYQSAFETLGRRNGNLAYRYALEQVRRTCARQIIDRWSDRLSVVDVWADSHCETAILHAIMH